MERQKNYEELTIRDHFMFGKICSKPENRKLILDSLLQIDFKEKDGTGNDWKAHNIYFNTTADLSNLPQDMKNMLEYINTGTTNDKATETLDYEVREARLKEEWRAEYMLTVVHDIDVYREGYESRQAEIDTLTDIIADKDATIADTNATLIRITKEFEEYKRTHP